MLFVRSCNHKAVQPGQLGVPAPAPTTNLVYIWGGRHRRLPEGFELPSVNLALALDLWCLGHPAKGWPPLCSVQPIDAGEGKEVQRRFSDYRALMIMIALRLKTAQKWVNNPTQAQVTEMYNYIRLHLPDTTTKGRKRRLDQVTWATVLRHCTKKWKTNDV